MADVKIQEKYQNRRYRLILYPDDPIHVDALAYIVSHFDNHIWILHDKDIEADGSPKKPHYHIIIEFPSARWNTAVSKELNITPNYMLPCNCFDKALEYLIHYNQEDKHQYSIDDCFGTLVGKLKDLLNKGKKSECEKIIDMLDFIDEQEGYCSFGAFVRHCADVGTFDVLRRSGVILMKCVEEHNHFRGSDKFFTKSLDK